MAYKKTNSGKKAKDKKPEFDPRMKEFWKHNLNPITGWLPSKRTNYSIIEDVYERPADQASVFIPRGFH